MLKNKLQRYFTRFLCKNLYNVIDKDDIVKIIYKRDGRLDSVFVQGKKLTSQEISLIAEQARNLKRSALWKYLCNDIEIQTQERMFKKCVSNDDVFAGQMVLWGLKITKKKLEELAKLASYEPKS